MAGKKTGKSSKTEHVLSLLSHPSASAPTSEPAESSASAPSVQPTQPIQTEQPAAQPTPPPPQPELRHHAPPILEVARSNQEAISQSIQNALEEEFERDLALDVSEQPEEPSQAPSSEDFFAPPKIEQPAPSADTEATSPVPAPPEPSIIEPSISPAPESSKEVPSPKPVPLSFEAINVVEVLVEENLQRYIKRCKACDCPRCSADIKALTLSRLPAQYIVTDQESLIPRLSIYRSKLENSITNQLIYACKTVTDFPRHKPSDKGE